MNIVIYARYSSHSQTEQSIEGQLHTCYEYAKSNGYLVVGEYIDRAQSRTTDSRAEFQRMIADSDKQIPLRAFLYISLTALLATATTAPSTKQN